MVQATAPMHERERRRRRRRTGRRSTGRRRSGSAGSVTSPAACCAAAVLLTRADSRSTSDSAISRNGGSTHRMSSHHDGGREEPAAGVGADDQVHHQRVEPEADDGGQVAGDQAGDQLAQVDLVHAGGGVGEELAGAPLALADDRARARRRSRWSAARSPRSAPAGTPPARTTPWCRRWRAAGTAFWAACGQQLQGLGHLRTAPMLPMLLMIDSRMAGTTRKKMHAEQRPSGSRSPSTATSWRRSVRITVHHALRSSSTVDLRVGEVVDLGEVRRRRRVAVRSPADGEVEVLERGVVGVDPGQAHAGGGQRGDEVGHPRRGRRAAPRSTLVDRASTADDALHAGELVELAGSSASKRTRLAGQYRRVSSLLGAVDAGRCRSRARRSGRPGPRPRPAGGCTSRRCGRRAVISRMSSSTAWDDSGSRPEVGSSKSSSSGSCSTERASARRVFMPVE